MHISIIPVLMLVLYIKVESDISEVVVTYVYCDRYNCNHCNDCSPFNSCNHCNRCNHCIPFEPCNCNCCSCETAATATTAVRYEAECAWW